MVYWTNANGDILTAADGGLYDCPDCPCPSGDILDCSGIDTNVPGSGSTVSVTIANTVLDAGVACDDANQMNGTYSVPWFELGHWLENNFLSTTCTTPGFDDYDMDISVQCASGSQISIQMSWGQNNFGSRTIVYELLLPAGGTISGAYSLTNITAQGDIVSMDVTVTF